MMSVHSWKQNKICEVDSSTKFQIDFLASSEGAQPFMTLYEVQGKWIIIYPEALKGRDYIFIFYRHLIFLGFKLL